MLACTTLLAASTQRPGGKLLIGVGLFNGEPFMPEIVLRMTRSGAYLSSRDGVHNSEIGQTWAML
jgi:hypothetical protein